MNVGVNYLREHIIQEARVHYAITNSGGASPNVVQQDAEVLYLVRAPEVAQVQDIYLRVCNIARGAALMTGTEVEIVFDKACSNVIQNNVLESVMYKNFEELGIPQHDDREKKLAGEVRATLTEQERNSTVIPFHTGEVGAMANWLEPIESLQAPLTGSSDVGDVSWIVPTAQCSTACFVLGSPLHSWQWVTLGSTSIAHKGMLHAGKVIAATAVEVLQNPELIDQAKAELKERLQGKAYVSPSRMM